jgi:hypothetical protein
MKKGTIAVCLFVAVSLELWSQSFDLPKTTNTINSIKEGVYNLIELSKKIGSPDYNSDWNRSEELLLKDMTAYLNSVLEKLNYTSIRDYVRLVRTNIDRIDQQAVSRNQMTDFENYLHSVISNNSYEIRTMQNEYKTKPFPFKIDRDENAISKMTMQIQEYEQRLTEYQKQLNALPTIAQLNNRLQEIRRELLGPNAARNARLKKQLEDEEAAIGKQKPEIDKERNRLTSLISDIQTQIQRSNLDSYIKNMDIAGRDQLIASTLTSFNDFYEWEKFFNNENTCIRDFFVLRETKQKLYKLLDNIPQGQVQSFSTKLDAFCVGWGI